MSADPTAEHIDAVARTLSTPDWGEWSSAYHPDHNKWTFDGSHRTDGEREMYRNAADAVLTSTDPAVHAALAASLPAEVMLAALVDRGNDAELARRLEWATGLIGATLLVAIRSEGLEVVRVKPEQVAP